MDNRNEVIMFKVGDLVWSVTYNFLGNKIMKKRLAIIKQITNNKLNPYKIQLIACGREGVTSEKYLVPMEETCKNN